MAEVLPFKAIRPATDKIHLVPSRAFGSYTKEEMEHKLKTNPFTFLHVLRPGFGTIPQKNTHRIEYLRRIKDKFEEFMSSGILVQDEQPGYYVYRQMKDGHTQTGIIGRISIEDYFNGTIKKHEATLSEREEKLKNYLTIVDINAEPVCFAYEDHAVISKLVAAMVEQPPMCDFSTTNEIRHQLWEIVDKSDLEKIEKAFGEIDNIYIADGHHRSASSCLLGEEKRVIRGKPDGALSDYFMGIFIPASELRIMDFNRIVKDLNGLSKADLLSELAHDFKVEKVDDLHYKPQKTHEFAMYLKGETYVLTIKEQAYDDNDPVGSLDATILNRKILEPLLGIKDIRTDKRINFVGGHEGMNGLRKRVENDKYKVAFALHPVTMEQLMAVADHNQVMPPKSTWIEPKLRSGLTIYSLSRT